LKSLRLKVYCIFVSFSNILYSKVCKLSLSLTYSPPCPCLCLCLCLCISLSDLSLPSSIVLLYFHILLKISSIQKYVSSLTHFLPLSLSLYLPLSTPFYHQYLIFTYFSTPDHSYSVFCTLEIKFKDRNWNHTNYIAIFVVVVINISCISCIQYSSFFFLYLLYLHTCSHTYISIHFQALTILSVFGTLYLTQISFLPYYTLKLSYLPTYLIYIHSYYIHFQP